MLSIKTSILIIIPTLILAPLVFISIKLYFEVFHDIKKSIKETILFLKIVFKYPSYMVGMVRPERSKIIIRVKKDKSVDQKLKEKIINILNSDKKLYFLFAKFIITCLPEAIEAFSFILSEETAEQEEIIESEIISEVYQQIPSPPFFKTSFKLAV